MNKILYILLISIVFLSVPSCSEDKMDEINENLNNPTDVESKLIITDAMVNTAFSVVSGDYAFYASIYIEHNVGCYSQFYNAEVRTTEPLSSSTYNNTWTSIYNNLYNLKIIIDNCSTDGSEEGNYHTLGIAQILSAINLAILTDGVGNTPWTEALQPAVIFTPVLDEQETIYNEVIQFLEDGIENLAKESSFPALDNQDPIYGGDTELWTKTAYGLLARYTMHLPDRADNYDKVIEYALQSFTSADEECKLDYSVISATSPFYALFTDRDYYGASKSLYDKLVAKSDPRKDYFWTAHPDADGTLTYGLSGDSEQVGQVQGKYGISALSTETAPTFLISYHEVQFLLAEAYAREGSTTEAQEALENAVVAAFVKIKNAITDTDLSASEVGEDYFNNQVLGRFNTNAISEILQQKYIAFFEEEAFEAYNDIRRLKAMGEGDIISLTHPEPDKFPLRYTYGNSDVTTNENVRTAYEDVDIYNDNVWWAGGSN